jgi:cytochrome c
MKASRRNTPLPILTLAGTLVLAGAAAGTPIIDVGDTAPARVAQVLGRERCHACHGLEEARIGPAYRMIAARHRGGGAIMADVLARKIIHGGAGNWGVVPMVANERVSLEEARRIARWILSLESPP